MELSCVVWLWAIAEVAQWQFQEGQVHFLSLSGDPDVDRPVALLLWASPAAKDSTHVVARAPALVGLRGALAEQVVELAEQVAPVDALVVSQGVA